MITKEEITNKALKACTDAANAVLQINACIVEAIDAAYALGLAEGKASNQQSDASSQQPTANSQQPSLAAIECPLTNSAVSGFLSDPSYDAPGFATSSGKSVVRNYCSDVISDKYATNWIEHPLPVKIGDRSYYNLVPGREYTLDGRLVRTTGTLRQIHFPDAATAVGNCRDIGGYKCDGGHVAYERLIRSARLPEGLTYNSSTAATLRDIGITCEIDLRGASVYTNLGWSGLKVSVYGYAQAVTDVTGMKTVFTRIINEAKKGGCVLLHCSAGADRTGTVVAALLGYLGVPEPLVIKDWEVTSFSYWFNTKEIHQWAERIADPKMKATALKEFPKGELREFFQAMASAFGKSCPTFQTQCAAWLTQRVGLTTSQLSDLKKAFIAP